MTNSDLRAALVSADDNLRAVILQAMQEGGLPVTVDLEIIAPSSALGPEHMERLRAGDPDLILLDISEDPGRGIQSAATIANGSPRAALIGIGPDLDSARLLEAMRAGLVEYLPRPLEPQVLHDALGRVVKKLGVSRSPDGPTNGELLAFFSPKGGSGSTTVVTNVGIELHRLTGKRTLLVDLDLELGEISSLLGIQPRFHFVDLVRNFHRMDEDLLTSYIESHESGVQVLSAPFEPEIGEEVSGDQIARILGFLRNHYDYILVDVSKSLAPQALAALQNADPIFLVTNMDVPSLRNLKRCLPILERVTAGDASKLRLVVNRYNPKSLVRLEDLEETLGIEVFKTLTNDFETVIQAISTGRPLVLQGSSKYSEELKELAKSIAAGASGLPEEKKSFVNRLLSPFMSSGDRSQRTDKNGSPDEASTNG